MKKEIVGKSMKCKFCKTIVENVGEKAISVTCDVCVQKAVDKAISNQDNMKGGINMENEKVETNSIEVKPLKVKKEKKISMKILVKDLQSKNKTDEEIMSELKITKKRLQDTKWLIKNNK